MIEPLPKKLDKTIKVYLSPPILEIAINMVQDLRIFMKLTPSGNLHLNSETKLAELNLVSG